MGLLSQSLLISLGLVSYTSAAGTDDKVTNLPGLNFKPNFDTYSGFLNANDDKSWQMHYWLTESKNDAANDPLLIWFNGGPGCSSFSGSLQEFGPFYLKKDGTGLFENLHSWNQRANVLALESPIGVGFSYSTTDPNFSTANDDQTADQNYAALADFFSRSQDKYKNRPFILAGESYAGVYIPTLSQRLIKGINDGTFPNPNFMGAAIGNGMMHVEYLLNSVVLWGYYHARMSVETWKTVKTVCGVAGVDMDHTNFTSHFKSTNGIDFVSNGDQCGNLTAPMLILEHENMDQYNYYQDCYADNSINPATKKRRQSPISKRHRVKRSANPAVDDMWQDSTDTQKGYPCWNEDALIKYSNTPAVQDALHIPKEWRDRKQQWADCSDPIYDQYHTTYEKTNQFFDYVLTNAKGKFRFLVYNGDVDTVCNYLGDAWFISEVAETNHLQAQDRKEWQYRSQTAGYSQRYASADGSKTIDVVTVKGAGHFVPNDRPGQSAQMITNFLYSTGGDIDYSSQIVSPTPKPLQLSGSQSLQILNAILLFAILALFGINL